MIPTDTVYGVAALPRAPGAVEAVFAAKGRRPDKPLPVLGSSASDLEAVAEFDPRARAVAQRFWPGALTLVLPRARGYDADLGGSASGTVAVRVPDCPAALAILRAAGPLAVTSANRSDEPPATRVADARDALGDAVGLYVDDGPRSGEPSTIVSLVGEPEALRNGAIDPAEVARIARAAT